MLQREIKKYLPRSVQQTTIAVPIPIKNTSHCIQKKIYENYCEYGEIPFFPSSSPPVSDFLKRLEQRNTYYNR